MLQFKNRRSWECTFLAHCLNDWMPSRGNNSARSRRSHVRFWNVPWQRKTRSCN
jgi:hypothetical protein